MRRSSVTGFSVALLLSAALAALMLSATSLTVATDLPDAVGELLAGFDPQLLSQERLIVMALGSLVAVLLVLRGPLLTRLGLSAALFGLLYAWDRAFHGLDPFGNIAQLTLLVICAAVVYVALAGTPRSRVAAAGSSAVIIGAVLAAAALLGDASPLLILRAWFLTEQQLPVVALLLFGAGHYSLLGMESRFEAQLANKRVEPTVPAPYHAKHA